MTTTIDTFTIGGLDYRAYADVTSLNISEGLAINTDTMSVDIVLDSVTFTSGDVPRPISGQKVQLSLSNGITFTGVVNTTNQAPYVHNLDSYKFTVDCAESVRLLDKHLVAEGIIPRFVTVKGVPTPSSPINRNLQGADYAGNIVRQLVAKYAPEFTVTADQGYMVPIREINYESLSSVIDSLAQGIGFVWYIDNYHIVFTSNLNTPAPVPSIDLDNTLDLGNTEIHEDTSRLVNKVVLKDWVAREQNWRLDQFIADGNQSFFPLFQEPWDAESVNVSVTPPGGSPVQYAVSLDPLSTREGDITGSPGQAFVCILNVGVRFPTSDIPDAGSNVDISYPPLATDQVLPVEEPASIRMMKNRESGGPGPTDGVYENTLSVPDFRVDNVSTVAAYGLFVLDRLAWPVISGQFDTMTTEGWKPGQTFTITSSKRDVYDHKTYWTTGAKIPPRMYIQSVTRKFANIDGGVIEIDTVSFSHLVSEIVV